MLQRGSFTDQPSPPPRRSSSLILRKSLCQAATNADDTGCGRSYQTLEVLDLEKSPMMTQDKEMQKPSSALKVKTHETSLSQSWKAKSEDLTTSSSDQPQTVRFLNVHVHFHDTVLGDNPSVSSGAPLAIGWQRLWAETHPVDVFEARQMPRRNPSGNVPKLSAGVRLRLLREAGESHVDIYLREEQINTHRYHQQESIRRAVTVKKSKKPSKKAHSSSRPVLFRTVKNLFVRSPVQKAS